MKNFLILVCFIFLASGCKKDSVASTQSASDLLTANLWKIDHFTSKSGSILKASDLSAAATSMLSLNFEFKSNNVVRASDQSKQIVNAGTWYLQNNNATMAIDVIGINDSFQVVQLQQGSMILQASNTLQVAGLDPNVSLVFVPSL